MGKGWGLGASGWRRDGDWVLVDGERVGTGCQWMGTGC